VSTGIPNLESGWVTLLKGRGGLSHGIFFSRTGLIGFSGLPHAPGNSEFGYFFMVSIAGKLAAGKN
jgi:hypothetical protein